MRVLLAGGVFRLSADERRRRQAAPEMVLSDGLRESGIDVRTVPLERWRRVASARDVDVVHVHHLSKAAVATALSPNARRLVFTEHASGHPASPLHRRAQRFVMARAAHVVCLSDAEAAAKRAAYGLPASRIAVIPNGIGALGGECRLRELGPRERVVLLFVGQLRPVKQVDRAVRALAELPARYALRLVFHDDADLPALRELAARLGVGDRVTFAGQKAGPALAEEYRRAHLLVLPSSSESLPSVVTEALLSGLPVLASGVGGIAGQVAEAGILVSPDPAESLAPAVAAIVADYPAYARRAFARAATASVEFSVESMITRHVALYRSLQNGSGW